MKAAIIKSASNTNLQSLDQLADQAHAFAEASVADNTKRAYRAGWNDFSSWCDDNGLEALPAAPASVALFLTARSSQKVSTLRVKLAAIVAAHKSAGEHIDTSDPVIATVWAGIRRTNGTTQKGADPVLTADICRMIKKLDSTTIGTRDRALLLLGFAGGFRRSELVSLDVADIAFSDQGAAITLRKGKTDQEGLGQVKTIANGHGDTCPVAALQSWLKISSITTGAVFCRIDRHGNILGRLTAQSVALVIKKRAAAVGLDSATISGHSLRSGCVTSAYLGGASYAKIAKTTGHAKLETVARYCRVADGFKEALTLGL